MIKAQLDLNTLIVTITQFLVGCERYKFGMITD